MSENDDTLLTFPTDFPVKIMGEQREGFVLLVQRIHSQRDWR